MTNIDIDHVHYFMKFDRFALLFSLLKTVSKGARRKDKDMMFKIKLSVLYFAKILT